MDIWAIVAQNTALVFFIDTGVNSVFAYLGSKIP